MNQPTPTIRVNVDPTNPGQFFACCGLLELANRLWPGTEVAGSFSSPRFERSVFELSASRPLSLSPIIEALVSCERIAVDPYQTIVGSDGKPVKDVQKIRPVELTIMPVSPGDPISLRLAWWLDELNGRQAAFKTWSAHNTAEGLVGNMTMAIRTKDITESNVFQWRVGMTSRLGLDVRSSWNTLDTGFSPNDQKLPVDTYAVTELLAAVGLETFRPASLKYGFTYAIWSASLPAVVARAVASGNVEIQGITCYRFEIEARGKFKFFTKAQLLERNTND